MTRRLVPVLVVALVVLAGCTAPGTQPTGTEATANGTTARGTAPTTSDATTTDGVNETATLESGPTPPGVAASANGSGVVVNASALIGAHERVLRADGFRATQRSRVGYGDERLRNTTSVVVAGPSLTRYRSRSTVEHGNRTVAYDVWQNESTTLLRTTVDGDTNYQTVGGQFEASGITGGAILEGVLAELHFSVANVTTEDGRRVFTLAGSRTAPGEPNASTTANGTYTARVVVDERGVVSAYRIRQDVDERDVTHEWTLDALGATPTRPDWTANVSDAARRNVSVDANVRHDVYPNPNGTGHVEEHGVLAVSNDGPDALPASTTVAITSNGTTYETIAGRELAAGETLYFVRDDGGLAVFANESAVDDPPNFANEVSVTVSANDTNYLDIASSYSYERASGDDGPDDEMTANATRYAPGVTSDGVVYAERLVDAHVESLVESGFEVRGSSVDVFRENGTTTSRSRSRRTVVASTNRTRVLERVEHDDGRVVESWKRGRHRVTRVEGTETLYRPRSTIDPASSLAVPVSAMRALEAGEFEVANVTERDGTTFATLTADRAEPPHDGIDVESFDARVVVDETGRIHAFRANATYVDVEDGNAWGGSSTFELVSVGEGPPARPSWVDDVPENARRDVDAYADVRNRSRVELAAHGEHPVPAGTTVVLMVDGERHETTLDAALEPEATRYLYVVDGDLRTADERADAVGRRLVDPSSIRIVTPDGVLLADDDLHLPAGNASAVLEPTAY
ncbi:hypothetical protein [Halorubellus sp. PRR65]|uniref:hypothetical protein n=1 Tax=Halorubellus sp. PRR65 TaxID=3098148 RepID=UPI002B25B571|nr:hypothetical protein [Halorubellus sp. PRR65]